MYWWAAISIGLLGSAHCAGMCGPILMAVNGGKNHWKNDILHHGGRLLTYMAFGAIAGALGNTFSVMGMQQWFSVGIGLVMVLSVLLVAVSKQFRQIENLISKVSIKFNGWIHSAGLSKSQTRFLMGVGNGILPCGLVYLAVAGAANTFTPWDGALFMLFFGLGTLPVLLGITQLSSVLTPSFRSKARRLIPITVFVMGLLLVARGSNLGIPYLSPKVDVKSEAIADCH